MRKPTTSLQAFSTPFSFGHVSIMAPSVRPSSDFQRKGVCVSTSYGKTGIPVNFCVAPEAHQALRDMLGGSTRFGAFLSALILEERARREERARLRQEGRLLPI